MWLPEVRACRGPEPARGFACGGEEASAGVHAVSGLPRGSDWRLRRAPKEERK